MPFIETTFGKIHYVKHGQGEPLVVLHGGPGCELTYLEAGLRPLAKWRELFIFDQFGCGRDANDPFRADFNKTVDHGLAFLKALKLDSKNIGLLGHSFGAGIAFGMMRKLSALRELIFLNPIPPTAELWGKIEVNLSGKDSARIEELTPLRTREAGVEIIQIYSRYYCESWPSKVPFEYHSFDMQLCEQVQKSMGAFDFRPQFSQVPQKSLLFLGERDFIRPELLKDYRSVFSKIIELPGAMHMPFLDRPQDFLSAITPYFEL